MAFGVEKIIFISIYLDIKIIYDTIFMRRIGKRCEMKKVLILCTGNSCRSIIAEALVNAKLEGIEAQSAGVRASGKVNAYAKRVLEEEGIWSDTYHSKTVDDVLDINFDLVVTVCDHANEACPMFPKPIPKIHVGFSDPDGKDYGAFILTYQAIEAELLLIIKEKIA